MVQNVTDFIRNLHLWRFFDSREEHRTDWINPICMLVLGVIGVIFIYSAQSSSGGQSWKMQGIWLVLGAFVYMVTSFINYKFFLEYSHIIYYLSIALLLPLAIQSKLGIPIPFIETRMGSTRWIDFGPFSIQPSETAKIGTLIMVASLLTRSEIGTVKESLKILAKVAVTFLIPILLIFLQPDLGSSLVFPPIVFSVLYVSNLSKRFFVAAFALFIFAVALVSFDIYRYHNFLEEKGISPSENKSLSLYEEHSFIPLHDYQRNRILGFIAPNIVDPVGNGISWNLNQSLIAVAGGGLIGKGFGEGTQAKLGYLPSTIAPNDFIFSVLAEESGFIGSMIVVTLLFLLVVNNVRIAGLAKDRFGTLLAVGVSVIFAVHIFINIGMTIGLMPITGLPLPFLSYGGSFMLSCCVLQGLVQSVYRYRKDFT